MPKPKPKFTPEELPSTRTRHGGYADLIEEFAESGVESARVDLEGRETDTVRRGLLYNLKTSGRDDIRVSRHGKDIYLIRTK